MGKEEFTHQKYLKNLEKKRKSIFVEKTSIWTSAFYGSSGRQIKKNDEEKNLDKQSSKLS